VSRGLSGRRGLFPYYIAAVLMHGTFNFFASFGSIYESKYGPEAYLIGLAAAFIIAISGIAFVRAKIRQLDMASQYGK
jgi:ABC-type antimicrobial peptide transport system permease subunit